MSSGVLAFLVSELCVPNFGAPDLGFSEFQVSEFQISEFQISEFQISEFQISEFQISEFQVSELLISEFLISEFLRSGAQTSQLTSLIVQEAVELADATKTVVLEFMSSGVLGFPGFRVGRPRFSEFRTSDFRSS